MDFQDLEKEILFSESESLRNRNLPPETYMIDLGRYQCLTCGTLHLLRSDWLQDLDCKRLLRLLRAINVDASLRTIADLWTSTEVVKAFLLQIRGRRFGDTGSVGIGPRSDWYDVEHGCLNLNLCGFGKVLRSYCDRPVVGIYVYIYV